MTTNNKRTQRLGRIFRKHTQKISTRDWNDDAASARAIEESFGVSLATLKKISESLSEEERAKAALGQEPTPLEEAAIAKRLARFGAVAESDTSAAASAQPAVDPEVLKRRMERFGETAAVDTSLVTPSVVDPEVLKRRAERFGATAATSEAQPPAVSVQEMTDAMKKRLERFGPTPTTKTAATATAAAAPSAKALTPEEQEILDRRAKRFA